MSINMNISEDGIRLIKEVEGEYLTAYLDTVGVLTIGHGHTNATEFTENNPQYRVYEGLEITSEQADFLLRNDLKEFVRYVNYYVTRPIYQRAFDALVSFTFNVGPGVFAESSILENVNNGNMHAAYEAFDNYHTAGGEYSEGIKNRRDKEKQHFLKVLPRSSADKLPKGLVFSSGTFVPKFSLLLSSDIDPDSPAVGTIPAGQIINYDSYVKSDGYIWISFIKDGIRRYVTAGPDDGNNNTNYGTGFTEKSEVSHGLENRLTKKPGVFIPHIDILISSDTDPDSPAVGTIPKHQPIYYDSYVIENGYAWISFIKNGVRRYATVGPDDGRTDTVYGTGFLDNVPASESRLIKKNGVFRPNIVLPISADTKIASPSLGDIAVGTAIYYDSYVMDDGLVWISFIKDKIRRYVAIGPDDGRTDTVYGTGF